MPKRTAGTARAGGIPRHAESPPSQCKCVRCSPRRCEYGVPAHAFLHEWLDHPLGQGARAVARREDVHNDAATANAGRNSLADEAVPRVVQPGVDVSSFPNLRQRPGNNDRPAGDNRASLHRSSIPTSRFASARRSAAVAPPRHARRPHQHQHRQPKRQPRDEPPRRSGRLNPLKPGPFQPQAVGRTVLVAPCRKDFADREARAGRRMQRETPPIQDDHETRLLNLEFAPNTQDAAEADKKASAQHGPLRDSAIEEPGEHGRIIPDPIRHATQRPMSTAAPLCSRRVLVDTGLQAR